MRRRSIVLLIATFVLTSTSSFAKNKSKDKDALPPWLLQAHTASVIIDPDSGVSPHDPNANQIARRDVQAALQKWGRFEPSLEPALRHHHRHLPGSWAHGRRHHTRPATEQPHRRRQLDR
jgi:hypothetical protein